MSTHLTAHVYFFFLYFFLAINFEFSICLKFLQSKSLSLNEFSSNIYKFFFLSGNLNKNSKCKLEWWKKHLNVVFLFFFVFFSLRSRQKKTGFNRITHVLLGRYKKKKKTSASCSQRKSRKLRRKLRSESCISIKKLITSFFIKNGRSCNEVCIIFASYYPQRNIE